MRGQSSVEFMIILAAFLTILSTFTIPQMINPARSAAQDIQTASQAKIACEDIANAINGVSPGENATDSVGVSLSDNWALKMESDPPVLKLGVQTGKGTVWSESNLVYGYDQKISDISAGSYIVIVERVGNESITKTENKIYVKVNPSTGGGKWRY